ncbi:hypothetical protein GCM10009872_13030 [Actinopolymorpha rutila]
MSRAGHEVVEDRARPGPATGEPARQGATNNGVGGDRRFGTVLVMPLVRLLPSRR